MVLDLVLVPAVVPAPAVVRDRGEALVRAEAQALAARSPSEAR